MADANGFMKFERIDNGNVPPLVRIGNFKEFHPKLDEEARRQQAARCMNCGVPLCGSALKLKGMVTGCPLHNFIPEWNDALYNGQFDMAAWRLLKTSSFPEFTGRVCPALCEKACNCGSPTVGQGAVTIHDNELFIIEKAFATGYMKPQIPTVRSGKKVAVIGAGNVAMDAARVAKRSGAEEVYILYRKGFENMPCTRAELEEAKEDGIKFELFKAPIELTEDGVKYIETKNEVDESGRVNTVTIEGTEGMFNCDSTIIAVSQSPRKNIVANTVGLETNKWGLLLTDEKGHTTRGGVFASGDVVTGANTVVHAVAYAKVVADSIEEYCDNN